MTSSNLFKKLIYSGIQPTSIPHIGNYFGAIKKWVDIQNTSANKEQQLVISIVDLHAITVPKDASLLNDYIYKCVATLLACGIDPEKTILYQQSQVAYHGQLSWILGCKVTMPQLSQMNQFKHKTDKITKDNIPLGLFLYPVLQTADILLFKATHVPVGQDQLQHLEFCRDIANKFNNFYKVKYFPLPQAIETDFTRLKSLRDPLKKMSKSDLDVNSRIDLNDSADLIRHKIKKAVTDSNSNITYDPKVRPGISTLLDIHAACTERDQDELVEWCMLNAINTHLYKQEVANALIDHLKPIQDKYARLVNDKVYLRKILDESSIKANHIAEQNYKQVCQIIGSF